MVSDINLRQIIKESIYREYNCGITREILHDIIKNINTKEIVTISGVRRCGKTTLLFQIMKHINKRENILYINFEDERLIDFSVEEFEKIVEIFYEIQKPKGTIYLFFDEIQEIDFWEKWIRRIYDSRDDIKFFITGSSSALLSSEFSTLLTGRNLTYNLFPFSFLEFANYHNVIIDIEKSSVDFKDRAKVQGLLSEYIKQGGFPAIAMEYRVDLLQQYFSDIIYRDIVKRYKIRDVKLLEDVARYLITNTGNLFSYNKLKNTFKTGIDTIKDYINYVISANLCFEASFFSFSLKESMNRNRKIYAIDTGLRNSVSFTFSEDIGRLVENIIFLTLKKKYKTVSYYSDKNEVDFIVKELDNSLSLFNVCFTNEIPDREEKGFKDFINAFPCDKVSKTIITHNYDNVLGDIKYIPLWKWLLY